MMVRLLTGVDASTEHCQRLSLCGPTTFVPRGDPDERIRVGRSSLAPLCKSRSSNLWSMAMDGRIAETVARRVGLWSKLSHCCIPAYMLDGNTCLWQSVSRLLGTLGKEITRILRRKADFCGGNFKGLSVSLMAIFSRRAAKNSAMALVNQPKRKATAPAQVDRKRVNRCFRRGTCSQSNCDGLFLTTHCGWLK